MHDIDLSLLSVEELLGLNRATVTQLRGRGIARTSNAPVGDYAEWLVARVVQGVRLQNSAKGCDVINGSGNTFQVKCRIVTDLGAKGERQLSPFRSWDCDYVVIVLFDARFDVRRMVRLPTNLVRDTARRQDLVGGDVVFATDKLLAQGVEIRPAGSVGDWRPVWVGCSEARMLIRTILRTHQWKKRIEDIGGPLEGIVRDGDFGRVKKELGIEHRWNGKRGVGSRGSGSYVEWRLPALRILAPDGRPIRSVDEWFRLAPPKKGAAQWQDQRSAKETAKAWFRKKRPAIPVELLEVLELGEPTRSFYAQLAHPEHVTRLDDLPGEHRNHDMLVIGHAINGLTVVAVEAKADETFGDATVGGYLKTSSKNPKSRAPERIRRLTRGVFGPKAVRKDGSIPEPFASVRYQLLHAVAGTLIEARAHRAEQAVFLVHEFVSANGTVASKVRRNGRDLRNFVSALTGEEASTETPFLVGPLAVPGDEHLPGCQALFIGKGSVDCGA